MNETTDPRQLNEPERVRLKIDETFDAYVVKKFLGRGGMGEVYQVRHQTLESDYAIKILPPSFAKRQDALQRFQNEARVMSRLNHTNIVRVDDFRMTDGLYWLRMELARGDEEGAVSLQDLADRYQGILPPDFLLQIMRDVIAGVAYAHSNGVVHRDLKPANVLLFPQSDGTLQAKVSDYGLVKLLGEEFHRTQVTSIISVSQTESREGTEEDTFNRALIGTWEYMAPEQQESGDVDTRSDVYSLGLMMYRLLTGRKLSPWPPSHYVRDLDSALDVFVLRALEPEPCDRFEDSGRMLEALDRIISNRSTGSEPGFAFDAAEEEAVPADIVLPEAPAVADEPPPEIPATDDESPPEPEKPVRISEHQVSADLEKVRALVADGNYDEAVLVLKALEEVAPNHPDVLRELHDLAQHRHREQIEALQAASRRGMKSTWGLLGCLILIFAGLAGSLFIVYYGLSDRAEFSRYTALIPDWLSRNDASTPVPPEPATPEPVTSETTTPEIATPETVILEPVTDESVPQPTQPQPTQPKPTQPQPTQAQPTRVAETQPGPDPDDDASYAVTTPTPVFRDPFAPSVTTLPGLKMEFIRIKHGSFMMGSESGSPVEQPAHFVRISSDFWIARREVTLNEFRIFMRESGKTDGLSWSDPDRPFAGRDGFALTGFKRGRMDTQPVVQVSWFGAMDFCQWLTRREASAGRLPEGVVYRLPTEAEWEYACRAGSPHRYHWGDQWDCQRAMGENRARSSESACLRFFRRMRLPVNATAPVGSFPPNKWGIFDTNGNAWEWCLDWFGPRYYSHSPNDDPQGPPEGTHRVIRGGGWYSASSDCTSSSRDRRDPGAHDSGVGFRPVLGRIL
ncbi:MAG TPA: bifunctional serine/threonine-protein kinase/formylglycine-generating enzyme family protein [bacterium]|nr:bifunctional serine/threonine-protein kinase/formylglycine-generating enzyme family protein [bacterium]